MFRRRNPITRLSLRTHIIPIIAGILTLTVGVLSPAASAWASTAHPTLLNSSHYRGSSGVLGSPDSPARTLLVIGPGFRVYADAIVPGVMPVTVTQPGAAGAREAAVNPQFTGTCGIITCSIYFTRGETRQINNDILLAGGGIAGLAVTCGLLALFPPPAGVILAVICGVGITVDGAFFLNAVSHAAADNGCLRIRYTGVILLTPVGYYDDHSSNCTN